MALGKTPRAIRFVNLYILRNQKQIVIQLNDIGKKEINYELMNMAYYTGEICKFQNQFK